MRLLCAIAAVARALLDTGCTASAGHSAASPSLPPPDPHTASALLAIAAAFNHDYDLTFIRLVCTSVCSWSGLFAVMS